MWAKRVIMSGFYTATVGRSFQNPASRVEIPSCMNTTLRRLETRRAALLGPPSDGDEYGRYAGWTLLACSLPF